MRESDSKVLLLGDFNLPIIIGKLIIISWPSGNINSGTISDHTRASELQRLIEDHSLEQNVKEPTRINRILDFIFTNECEMIQCRNHNDDNVRP